MHSHMAQAVNRKASTTLFVRAHWIRNTTQTSATHTSKRVDMEGLGGIGGFSVCQVQQRQLVVQVHFPGKFAVAAL